MIKIVSGHSEVGGSTVAHINLCNALNRRGVECKFYGPHRYHLDKCNSDMINNFISTKEDKIIAHVVDFNFNIVCDKLIYSCHEKEFKPMNTIKYSMYDKVHYVSEPQRLWHNIDHPYFVCGNVTDDLKMMPKVKNAVGIIGTIDRNKQTHKSILRALNDGFENIYLFGTINHAQDYYEKEVKPLLNSKVRHVGYAENKQMMYNYITDVYQDSLSETWGYVKAECLLTGTKFHGNDSTEHNFNSIMTNDQIVDLWIKELS